MVQDKAVLSAWFAIGVDGEGSRQVLRVCPSPMALDALHWEGQFLGHASKKSTAFAAVLRGYSPRARSQRRSPPSAAAVPRAVLANKSNEAADYTRFGGLQRSSSKNLE